MSEVEGEYASDQVLIAKFPKNAREDVYCTLVTTNRRRYADLRVYYSPDADEPEVKRPTRKGLAIPVRNLPNLLVSVEKLCEAAVKEGVLEGRIADGGDSWEYRAKEESNGSTGTSDADDQG